MNIYSWRKIKYKRLLEIGKFKVFSLILEVFRWIIIRMEEKLFYGVIY